MPEMGGPVDTVVWALLLFSLLYWLLADSALASF